MEEAAGDYGACLAREGAALAQSPEALRCDADGATCRIFLACDNAPIPSCAGGGYALRMEPDGEAMAVRIEDPDQRTTRYRLCGICVDIAYVDGPLSSASIVPAGGGHVDLPLDRAEM